MTNPYAYPSYLQFLQVSDATIYLILGIAFLLIPIIHFGPRIITYLRNLRNRRNQNSNERFMPQNVESEELSTDQSVVTTAHSGGRISRLSAKIGRIYRAFDAPFTDLAEFFAWFIGTDLTIYRRMSLPIKIFRTGFGFTVFCAVTLSAILVGKNYGSVYGGVVGGVFIGVIWFCLVGGIDRQIIILSDRGASRKVMIARFVMVICLSYINTCAILQDVYHTEINTVIGEKKSKEKRMVVDSIARVQKGIQTERNNEYALYNSAVQAYAAADAAMLAKIDSQRAIVVGYTKRVSDEVAGYVGSGIKGYGPATKANEAMLAQNQQMLDGMIARHDETKESMPEYLAMQAAKAKFALRDSQLVDESNQAAAFLKSEVKKITDRKQDGFENRNDAMWTAARNSPFFFFMYALMFMTIESMAVIFKLLSPKTSYDEEVQRIHQQEMLRVQQEQDFARQLLTNEHREAMKPLLKREAEQSEALKSTLTTIYEANITRFDQLQQQLNRIEDMVFTNVEEGKRLKKQYRDEVMKTAFMTTLNPTDN